MMRLFTLLLLVASGASFTSPQPWRRTAAASRSTVRRFMDADKKERAAPALQVVDETVPPAEQPAKPMNVVKNMNTGEFKEVAWTDPAMQANTNPFLMSWWAYILFGFPLVVLLNDAFHFLPTEGPLAILSQF